MTSKMKEYSKARIVLGTLIAGCCIETLTHDRAYIQGGITFGLETIFDDGSNVDIAKVILYSFMALLRIVFEGFGAVMLLPWLVPSNEVQNAATLATGKTASGESDKRQS